MNPRAFALVAGIVMVIMGVFSLIPGLVGDSSYLPRLAIETSYGNFLGLFPMNILNKIALILFGVAGIWAARVPGKNLPMSIFYSRAVFVVMGVLTLLGIFPATNTLFGYWPLFGNEVWMHGIFSLLGAYYGFALTSKVPEDRTGRHLPRESLAR